MNRHTEKIKLFQSIAEEASQLFKNLNHDNHVTTLDRTLSLIEELATVMANTLESLPDK